MSISNAAATSGGSGTRTALVSGASFAGLAMAFWLRHLGYAVTVVEVAQGLRGGGTPVDISGESLSFLTRMGLLDAIRAKALPPRRHEFLRIDGSIVVAPEPDGGDDAQDYEVHRSDLLKLLADALDGPVDILFERSITNLKEDADAVLVTFSDGTSQRYTLVFGCDGNRSNTRKLVFGDDARFNHFMGAYICSKVLNETILVEPHKTEVVSMAGRMMMLNGYVGQTDIVFNFRTAGEIAYDHRDKPAQRRLIHEDFDGLPWKVQDMLAKIDEDDDFYFDRMTQIRMPTWSRGRVALVGDAGYCVSPLAGFGGSIAIIGAGHLGDALARHPNDHEAAFRDYERGLRPFVEEVQKHAATAGVQMLIPASDAELAERDQQMVAGQLGPFEAPAAQG